MSGSPVDIPMTPPKKAGPIVPVMGRKPILKRIMDKRREKKRLVPR